MTRRLFVLPSVYLTHLQVVQYPWVIAVSSPLEENSVCKDLPAPTISQRVATSVSHLLLVHLAPADLALHHPAQVGHRVVAPLQSAIAV